MGRRTKLTKKIKDQICEILAKGATQKMAFDSVGVSHGSFYAWLKKGEAGKEKKYVDFLEAVKKAEAQGKIRMLEEIRGAVDRCWRANAWILERRWPEEWAKREFTHNINENKHDIESIKKKLESNPELGEQLDNIIRELGKEE
jgi:hypothetical protein